MHRLIIVIGLECYAFALAFMQLLNGVRTDEAKYLLNIPYPHPPLARWLLSLFDGFAWQELGARILFATVMVQAVWIVWDMGRALRLPARVSLCTLWLGSAAFVLQAGTVMMAPLTALQALLFLWMLSVPRERLPRPATIGFLWLLTLFTALQGVLLAPLVIALLRHRGERWGTVAWYAGVPLVLLGAYALGNPLILASLFLQAGMDAANSVGMRVGGLLWVLVLAGSGVGSIVGIAGLGLKRHWWILASFVLIALYVVIGRYDYYAILFLPFFVTGAKHLFRRMPVLAVPSAIVLVACTVLLLMLHAPLIAPRSPARYVLHQLDAGLILVNGSMGHEWQYEALPGQDVRPYRTELRDEADAIVCRSACEDLGAEWMQMDGGLQGVWFPR